MGRNKAVRKRLWEADPYCYYCGILTKNEPRKGMDVLKDDDATIEHLESRYQNPKRKFVLDTPIVIACYRCNSNRNKKEAEGEYRKKHRYFSMKGVFNSWNNKFLDIDFFDRF